MNIKCWGGNYKEKLHPWYLATPLWPWHNMGKEAKKKSEGSRVQIQVSSDICVLSAMNYYQASPGVTYCKRYLPWFITSTWAKKGGQKRNLRISLKQPVVGRLISIMANQKVNERGVSKLAEIWVKSTEVEGHEILPPLPAQNQSKNPVKTLLSLSNGMVRLPEKQIKLNKIPERKYPYLLKLV